MTEVATIQTQTPPLLSGPSEKERKYDRQLRLWAASGQAALESSSILLVNSSSGTVGVETLKNLVLPGIGKFTIADGANVQEADLGVNFFLDASSLGKPRAQACADLLVELNPEVEADWFPKNSEPYDLAKVLESPEPYTIILYALPIKPEDLKILEAYAADHKTPLIAVHSAGFYAYFRVHLPAAFPIVDTHPDETATTDLRLLTPWAELSTFAQDMTKDIDGLDNHEHGHLPFVAILLHYLEAWKQSHKGEYPSTYQDKVAFRRVVAEAARTDTPEGGEENFDEAAAAVLKTISPPSLPESLRHVFEYRSADLGRKGVGDEETQSSFWIIAGAVKAFYEKHRCLPVPGGLPDMKAQSSVYIQLQGIYKAKARKDAAEVLDSVRRAQGANTSTRQRVFYDDAMTSLERPCSSCVYEELANDDMAAMGVMPASLLPIYLALRATSHALDTAAAGAALSPETILKDVTALVPRATESERYAQAAQEVSRAAGGELHNVSAVMGGLVAQEMIKIITKQYIPVHNTCIFDGIGSRCQVLRL
ncbi:NEDD8-activating enzyme E1 regulatory subunit [Verticillium alfalfae VaMs.102]|uniref:NEDD8-activating enzyme E1 regulatory subunit n=1 Tax=Verticillium alfalfae (strain VaMs.102 / ATCC MYA-4576 / FGSC 10136) TaxID=526221 RepID=C9S788_VERA1|nr:NEDD8-activating enzyme E1 regulatory subunit [Verticillium alfalfae VaMs.102]EEY14673.1 NEDD8-activating enzyme E1 regulatory subunit [Verticillium alfalfae VaMs.102]